MPHIDMNMQATSNTYWYEYTSNIKLQI